MDDDNVQCNNTDCRRPLGLAANTESRVRPSVVGTSRICMLAGKALPELGLSLCRAMGGAAPRYACEGLPTRE